MHTVGASELNRSHYHNAKIHSDLSFALITLTDDEIKVPLNCIHFCGPNFNFFLIEKEEVELLNGKETASFNNY